MTYPPIADESELPTSTVKKQEGMLVGDAIPWSQITDVDNKREWLWENYIAKGHVTLLSALWKAGKSTLLRCLFVAMAQEEEFAGQPTKRGKVLILSEEAQSDWFDKKEELEGTDIDNILIWSRPIRFKPNQKQWVEIIQSVAQKCIDEKIDMVVIDTLSSFWAIENENDSAQVSRALVPFYNFTENNIAVLLIHHFRKGGGDHAQASRGSGALPSFVDNIVEFTRREDGTNPRQRELRTYGRFDEVIPKVVIELTPEGVYKTLGEPWQVSKNARLQRVIEILQALKVPSTITDIRNIWVAQKSSDSDGDITTRSLRRYVNQLCFEKVVSAVGERMVFKKLTPIYQLSEDFINNGQELPAFSRGVVPSPVNSEDSAVRLLSAVDGKVEATAQVRTGISAIEGSVKYSKLLRDAEDLFSK